MMKKALLDQMFLGFLAIFAVTLFVATVADERSAKNKVYDLQDLTQEAIRTLSQEYYKNMQGNITTGPVSSVMTAICNAQDISNDLINASDLGSELISKNKINFTWRDLGTYDPVADTYDGITDGRPDTIEATVGSYTKTNFWYKMLDKDTFEIPGFTRAADLNRFTYNVNVTFRGVINAGFYNMVGTYELDANGCPTNAQLVLDNKKDWESKVGDIITNIEMPQTRMFFIADGYRRFGNYNSSTKQNNLISTENTTITFDNNGSTDCTTGTPDPTVVLTRDDGVTERSDDSHSSLTSKANVYFQDDYLNFDNQDEHMREIAEKDWGAFVAYTEQSNKWNSEAWAYYNALSFSEKNFKSQDLKNIAGDIDGWDEFVSDRGLTPDFDPDSEYVYISEDLASTTDPSQNDLKHDWWASDRDFTDMSFSMLKIFVPEPIDPSLISSESIINVTCP